VLAPHRLPRCCLAKRTRVLCYLNGTPPHAPIIVSAAAILNITTTPICAYSCLSSLTSFTPSTSASTVSIARQIQPASNNGKHRNSIRRSFKSQLTPRRVQSKLVFPMAGRFAAPTRRISPTTSTPIPKTRDGSRPRAPTRTSSRRTWRKTIAQRALHPQAQEVREARSELPIFS
jgi:hypothetical protein